MRGPRLCFALGAAVIVAGCGARYQLGVLDTESTSATASDSLGTASDDTGTGTDSGSGSGTSSASTTTGVADLPQMTCDMETEFIEPVMLGGAAPRGMTFHAGRYETSCGISLLRCGSCDPYQGDTPCSTPLQVLCFRPDMMPNPGVANYDTAGWSGGSVAAAPARAADSFVDRAEVDAYCEAQLGPGFRVAEFHDGKFAGANGFFGGWGFWAYGNVEPDQRYWTYIDDQTNCWAH